MIQYFAIDYLHTALKIDHKNTKISFLEPEHNYTNIKKKLL